MFRLNNIHIWEHPILQNNKLDFQTGEYNASSLFTTVIIGPNATGKSNILKTIADIFRLFAIYKKDSSKKPGIAFGFLLRYTIDGDIYEITIDTQLTAVSKKGRGNEKQFLYYKNRPAEIARLHAIDFKGISEVRHKNKPYIVKLSELELPSVLLASSIMLTDKFNSVDTDFYKYLGVRNPNSPSTAGTRTYVRKTTNYIVECLGRKDFKTELKTLLEFLGLDNSINITYVPKYKTLFWKGDLTLELFHSHFKNWKEAFNRESEPWGRKVYINIQKDSDKISELVSFLNATSLKLKPYGQGGRYFAYSILDDIDITKDFEIIQLLDKLDLISYPSLHFSRNDSQYAFDQSSSGETHFISSFIGLLSQVKENGLILIDEPEISLHPNWQIEYNYFLKTIFKQYPSCHFVIATHSHFILSDLKPDTSNIIALSRTDSGKVENLRIDYDTYGWSVNEILYKVFKVRTTRNEFFENDLRKLYVLLTENPDDKQQITRLLNNIKQFNISEEDPLNKLIESANQILENA